MGTDRSAWEDWDQLIHGADPDPIEVLRAASQFQRYFEAVQGAAVDAARRNERTWDEIGQALGVTRQAAWARFATTEHEQLTKVLRAQICRTPPR